MNTIRPHNLISNECVYTELYERALINKLKDIMDKIIILSTIYFYNTIIFIRHKPVIMVSGFKHSVLLTRYI